MGFRRYTEIFLEIAIVAAVAVGIFLFGSVESWAWGGRAIAISGLAMLALVRSLVVGKLAMAWSPVALVAVAAVALVGFQVVPLPMRIFRVLAPATASLYTGLGHTVGRVSVSLDRYATKVELLKLFSLCVFFGLLLVSVRRQSTIRWMLGTIVGAAFVAGLLGVLQSETVGPEKIYFVRSYEGPNRPWIDGALSPAESEGYGVVRWRETAGGVYWVRAEPVVGDIFGPFVSSNHFGALGAMGATLAFGFGLIAAGRLGRMSRERRGILSEPAGNVLSLCAFLVIALLWMLWYAGARSGFAAALLSMIFLTALAAVKRFLRVRTAVIAIAILLVAGAAGILAQTGWPGHPLAEAGAAIQRELAPRVEIWSKAVAFAGVRALGLGLGTFPSFHIPFGDDERIAFFAHSEPVQWFVETGVVGAALGVLFIVGLAAVLLSGVRAAKSPHEGLLLITIVGGLLALLIVCLVDYGLHVYGLALAGVALAGCGIALSAHVRCEEDLEATMESLAPLRLRGYRVVPGRLIPLVQLLVGGALLAGFVWVVQRHVQAEELALPLRRLLVSDGQREILGRRGQQIGGYAAEAVTKAGKAISKEPWAGGPAAEIGEFFLLTGALGEDATTERGTPYKKGSYSDALGALERAQALNWLDRFPAISAYLSRSVEEGAQARLAGFEERIGTYGELGIVYWIAGRLAEEAGEREKARTYCIRALTLQRDLVAEVLTALREGKLGDMEEFLSHVPDDAVLLTRLADGLVGAAPERVVRATRVRAYEALTKRLASESSRSELTLLAARAARSLGKPEDAAAHYGRYLASRGEDAEVRFEYAGVLFELKQYGRADQEVREVLRIDPRHDRALVLQTRLKPFLPGER
ncbi:MAG: O-antigen ligase family protein [Planctomycetota bacterium]